MPVIMRIEQPELNELVELLCTQTSESGEVDRVKIISTRAGITKS